MSAETNAVLEFEQYAQAFKDKGLFLSIGDWDVLGRTSGGVFWVSFSEEEAMESGPHMSFLTLEEVKAFYRGLLCKEIMIQRIKESL